MHSRGNQKIAAFAALAVLAAGPAAAQSAPAPTNQSAPAPTKLTLSAEASAAASPDRIAANLSVTGAGPTAAAAQQALNLLAVKAMTQARAASGVTATIGFYSVYRDETPNKPTVFRASQEIALLTPAPQGAAPREFLDLLARLQSEGLLLQQLTATLSPEAEQAAQQQATDAALARLRANAAHVAAELGAHVAGIESLTLGAPPPPPRQLRMMALAVAAPAPPEADSGPVMVNETASGVFLIQGATK